MKKWVGFDNIKTEFVKCRGQYLLEVLNNLLNNVLQNNRFPQQWMYCGTEKAVKNCEFKKQENGLIRDKIILGCKNKKLQSQLLKKANILLNKCIEVASI